MLSALIPARHSYAALPLTGQLPHQRSVHSGPLVAYSPVSRSADYTFTRPRRNAEAREVAYYLYELSFSWKRFTVVQVRIFRFKSLRGQTKHSKQFLFRFFMLGNVIFTLYEQHEFN